MLLRSIACSLFVSCAFVAAQTPCISLNDATAIVGTAITATSFAGPSTFAYRFTPASSQLLMAAEIFTSNALATSGGYQTLEIWDEGANGLPNARLGGGTWQSQATLPLGWHGANFDQLVQLQGATNYWLVWREGGSNRLPYEPGGTTVPFARLLGGNWVLQAAQQPVKWRGYCSQLDGPGVTTIGFGCASTTPSFPAVFTNHAPTIGNANFRFEATGLPPGGLGLVAFGVDPSWVSIPLPGAPSGCQLNVDPLVLVGVAIGSGNQQVSHANGASGHAWVALPLPNDPALVGVVVGAQFAALDVGSVDPLPFVFSNGLRITLF